MRNAQLLLCLLLLVLIPRGLTAQQPVVPLNDRPAAAFHPPLSELHRAPGPGTDVRHPRNSDKTAAVLPLGQASNIFSSIRPEQNQISTLPTGEVVFIHRNSVGIWGGSSGDLRYDCSTDFGQSWNVSNGVLNPTTAAPARYPNMVLHQESGGALRPVWTAPGLGVNSWDGHINGVVCNFCDFSASGDENYDFLASQNYLPSGLTEGLPGEFWTANLKWDGNAILDSIVLYKSTYTNCTTPWVRHTTLTADFNSSPNGKVAIGPNVAFSPDGMTGYVVAIGDVANGIDSILTPIVYKTADGGATWSGPDELDLSGIQFVRDSLQTLFGQTANSGDIIPVSSGQYTCTSDYDITVDRNGNLHIFNLLASGRRLDADSLEEPGAYILYPGLAKLMVDIHTPDGGATWDAKYIAPGFAWQGDFGTPTPVTLENFCQVARDLTGDHIFYSWADQDTSGGLFGVSDLIIPNLRIAGLRISDGYQTCAKPITDGIADWRDVALAPTLAPVVFTQGNTFSLPIAMPQLLSGDPFSDVAYSYFGDEATLQMSDFTAPSSIDHTAAFPCTVVGTDDPFEQKDWIDWQDIAPNPSDADFAVGFELGAFARVRVELVDLAGRDLGVLGHAALDPGAHQLYLETGNQAPGIYFLRMIAQTEDGRQAVQSKRIVLH